MAEVYALPMPNLVHMVAAVQALVRGQLPDSDAGFPKLSASCGLLFLRSESF